MLSVADAQARILERVPRLPEEELPIGFPHSILARDVFATRPLPGCDASAMDGYAARSAELPGVLPIAATIVAGALDVAPLAPGTCAHIMTGAPLPAGADCVVILEDAREANRGVLLPATRPGDNVRREGEDVKVGDRVLERGTVIGAGELAMLAAQGYERAPTARTPYVAIISTGDELVDLGTTPARGQVVDSSAYMLIEQVHETGAQPTYLGIAKDDRDVTREMIARALAEYGVVVTTGGVSMGERDFVRGALADAGIELQLWKVAMKPGKPFAFGTSGDKLAFALPGNPASTMVAFELFVRPALLAMQGAANVMRPRAPVILERGYQKQAGRAHYLRARVHRNGVGLIATPHPRQDSHALTSLVGVDALVEIGAHVTEVAPGGQAPALLLRAV